jgi:hypothetical protein
VKAKQDPKRNARLAALHIRAREVGLIDGEDKTAWRTWLAERFAGLQSAADLDDKQLAAALTALKRGIALPPSDRPVLDMIQRQLESLGKAEAYAEGIARKMFGKDRLKFCTDPELRKIIAALRYSQKRAVRKQGSGSAVLP